MSMTKTLSSVFCFIGSQRSEVVCTELEAGVVEDKYCIKNISIKPDDKQRFCNEHLCPARYLFLTIYTCTWYSDMTACKQVNSTIMLSKSA